MISALTIIIPSYNKKNYITECINSVINQTYEDWRLIIIDDCSTDGSQEVLKKFNTNKKIKIIFLKKNKGPSFCRNLGIRLSFSKYIGFLDADDFWEENKLEDQIKFMKEKTINFSFTDYYTLKSNDLIKKTNIVKEFKQYGLSDLIRSFIGASKIILSTLLVAGIWYPSLILVPALLMAVLMISAQYFHFKTGNPWQKQCVESRNKKGSR